MNFGGLSFLGLGAGNVRSTVCVHVGDDRLGTFSLFTFLFLFGEAASHALTFQLFSSSASSDSSAFLTLLPFVGFFFSRHIPLTHAFCCPCRTKGPAHSRLVSAAISGRTGALGALPSSTPRLHHFAVGVTKSTYFFSSFQTCLRLVQDCIMASTRTQVKYFKTFDGV